MTYLPFFLVILATVIFSSVFSRFHLPWVPALIVGGMVFGPFGFDIVETNQTLDFIANIGLVFLMFLAGLQTKLSTFQKFDRDIGLVTLLNGLIPFVVGFLIGWLFGFTLMASLLLGIIFMSSSIAVVIPALEYKGVMQRKVGSTIISATMINDIASLVLLSMLLQALDPITDLPVWSFYILLITMLVGMRYALPKIRSHFPKFRDEKDLFESEVRLILAMLLGTVILFEALGLHPIIAGFFSGLVLSDSINSDLLMQKIHTIGYSIFIPVFFIVVGLQTDLSMLGVGVEAYFLIFVIVVGSMLSKFGSGYLAGSLAGFGKADSLFIGAATVPQLSTTLAVVATAAALDLVPPILLTAMVVLSMISTVIAPAAMQFIKLR